ncbi:MAG: LiaF-related protein [Bacteroidota bacterium]|nr:LiaF-related protein [Bacteroidota bacterium]
MKKQIFFTSIFLFTPLLLTVTVAQDIRREVKRTTEKEVKVVLHSSFGSVNLEKGTPDKIAEVYYRQKERDKDDHPKVDINYSVHRDVGDLHIEMHPESSEEHSSDDGDIRVHANLHFRTDEWYVKLAEGIPLSIEAELGAGKSDFDFSGLTINDLSISTGASSSKIRFDQKNKNMMEDLNIETGVSKFVAENLNNANFKNMKFEGGVGSYYLDFGGELDHSVDVNISVGLGSITLVIPQDIGVKVKYEDSWLSNFSIDDEFIRKRKGVYESENYASAHGQMNLFVESGLGSVKIRRSK